MMDSSSNNKDTCVSDDDEEGNKEDITNMGQTRDESTYRCGHCKKSFKGTNRLMDHMDTHAKKMVKKKKGPSVPNPDPSDSKVTRNKRKPLPPPPQPEDDNKSTPTKKDKLLPHQSGVDYPRISGSGRRPSLGWSPQGKFRDLATAKLHLKQDYRQVSTSVNCSGKKIYFYCKQDTCPGKVFLLVPMVSGNKEEVTLFVSGNPHNHDMDPIPPSDIIKKEPDDNLELDWSEQSVTRPLSSGIRGESPAMDCINSFFAKVVP